MSNYGSRPTAPRHDISAAAGNTAEPDLQLAATGAPILPFPAPGSPYASQAGPHSSRHTGSAAEAAGRTQRAAGPRSKDISEPVRKNVESSESLMIQILE